MVQLIQLVVKDGLHDLCKPAINTLKRFITSANQSKIGQILASIQVRHGITKPKRLINSVETGWNSDEKDMLERYEVECLFVVVVALFVCCTFVCLL